MNVSVIIPTYRPGEYLWDCIESLQRQSLSNDQFEVLLVLNGEKDPYYSSIEERLNNITLPVRFFYISSPGVSKARNFALDRALGQYIAFIDDDDRVSPNYLKELLHMADVGDSRSIVCSNVKTFDQEMVGNDYISNAYSTMKESGKKFSLFAYRHFLSSSCCKIIPTDIIRDCRFPETIRIGEDAYFMAAISNKIKNIILAPQSAIYYRRLRLGSASRKRERLVDKLKRKWNLLVQYGRLYINGFPHYNLPFFLSRIVAIIVK